MKKQDKNKYDSQGRLKRWALFERIWELEAENAELKARRSPFLPDAASAASAVSAARAELKEMRSPFLPGGASAARAEQISKVAEIMRGRLNATGGLFTSRF